MKLKHVYISVAIIFLIVGLSIFKLNDFYRDENTHRESALLQSQNLALRTTLANQITQFKNILSSYAIDFDEAKLNWVQLKPFYSIAQVQEELGGRITIKKAFFQSGSAADRWSVQSLESLFVLSKTTPALVNGFVVMDKKSELHLGLIYFDQPRNGTTLRQGLLVVGDLSFFQKLFDAQRSQSITEVLSETSSNKIISHSEFSYVGNAQQSLSDSDEYIDESIKGTNLKLQSVVAQNKDLLVIPLSLIGLILGLGFLATGAVFYFYHQHNLQLNLLRKKSLDSNLQSKESIIGPSDIKMKPDEIELNKPVVAKQEKSTFKKIENKNAQPVRELEQKFVQDENVKPDLQKKSAAQKNNNLINEDFAFNGEPQIVSVSIEACLHQALVQLGLVQSKPNIYITKDFKSENNVKIDFAYFKAFFAFFIEELFEKNPDKEKHLFIKIYDQNNDVNVEMSTTADFENFISVYTSGLAYRGCNISVSRQFQIVTYKFTFESQVKENTMSSHSTKGQNILHMDTNDLNKNDKPKPQEKPNLNDPVDKLAQIDEIDLDSLLDLQLDKMSKTVELQFTEEPKFKKSDIKVTDVDQIKVEIRRPERRK